MKMNNKFLKIMLAMLLVVSVFTVVILTTKNDSVFESVSADSSLIYGYWGKINGTEGYSAIGDDDWANPQLRWIY